MTEVISMFQWVYSPEAWVALFTLTLLEVVLGIDNVVFISIIVDKLPKEQQDKARKMGLLLAMLTRLALLVCISWVMGLKVTLFTLLSFDISGKDLILIVGGIFLIAKSAHEIHSTVEIKHHSSSKVAATNFVFALVQIAILDIIFSLDSVITAVGLVKYISVMMVAVVLSVCVMLFAAKPIGKFVNNHPSIKTLALAFLILIGFVLVGEGFDYHIPKGFIYGAMAIALFMDLLDIRRNKNERKLGTCPTCGSKIK
jgi:predicted tellurium resistance membrane protein TerC